MINLEWLRTFRAVYKTKSLSEAAALLKISQPTISQHIATLEAHIGQQLFIRKSKGVLETDQGKMLNTLISGPIESLEGVEVALLRKKSDFKCIVSVGISEHLYKTTLCHRIFEFGDYVHLKFDTKNTLIKEVALGKLLYAIVPDQPATFDVICHHLFKQHFILVGTPDTKLQNIADVYQNNRVEAEHELEGHKWYAHDASSSFIKAYWVSVFDKKRPSIVPNYVIPNEYEVLYQLSKGSGLSVTLKQTAAPFLKEGSLVQWNLPEVFFRNISLISNKKRANPDITAKFAGMLQSKN